MTLVTTRITIEDMSGREVEVTEAAHVGDTASGVEQTSRRAATLVQAAVEADRALVKEDADEKWKEDGKDDEGPGDDSPGDDSPDLDRTDPDEIARYMDRAVEELRGDVGDDPKTLVTVDWIVARLERWARALRGG